MLLPIVELKWVESEEKIYAVNSLVNPDHIVMVTPLDAAEYSILSSNQHLRGFIKARDVFKHNEQVLLLDTGQVLVIRDRIMPAVEVRGPESPIAKVRPVIM